MFEVDLYRTLYPVIFRLPEPSDFHVWKTVRCKTREEAMGHVKGDNAAAEGADAPYAPIRVYSVQNGRRKLVWSQVWDDCYGNSVPLKDRDRTIAMTTPVLKLTDGTVVKVGDKVQAKGEGTGWRVCEVLSIAPDPNGRVEWAILTAPTSFGTVMRSRDEIRPLRRR